MYKCKCWNERYFKEVYRNESLITIEDWEFAWSFNSKSDLIEVLCETCWDSSEDLAILLGWEELIIN